MASTGAKKIDRGQVWLVRFDPTVGDEISKVRPAVVMSIAAVGRLQLRIVVPITTGNAGLRRYPWMMEISKTLQNGLDNDSFADCFQVKSLSENRFVTQLGVLTQAQIAQLAATVAYCVGYTPPKPPGTP